MIKALLITCLNSEYLIKNLSIVRLSFDRFNFSYNFFISLAIANGCSNSEPISSNLLSANLGSSLFFEINQNFL